MSKDSEGFYAHVRWHPDDVHELKPEWTLEQCEDWLAKNEDNISDRLIERGWVVMETLLDDEDCCPVITMDTQQIRQGVS